MKGQDERGGGGEMDVVENIKYGEMGGLEQGEQGEIKRRRKKDIRMFCSLCKVNKQL